MDMLNISEFVSGNPGALFIAGIIFGYLLRMCQSKYAVEKPKRYQSRIDHTAIVRQPVTTSSGKEPSFEWSDAVVQSLTKRPLNPMQLDKSHEV